MLGGGSGHTKTHIFLQTKSEEAAQPAYLGRRFLFSYKRDDDCLIVEMGKGGRDVFDELESLAVIRGKIPLVFSVLGDGGIKVVKGDGGCGYR